MRADMSGSPPGNAFATASAEAGRMAGSGSRQRKIARSTMGSSERTWLDGVSGSDSCPREAGTDANA